MTVKDKANKTKVQKFIQYFQNHWFFSILIFFFFLIINISNVIDAGSKIYDLFVSNTESPIQKPDYKAGSIIFKAGDGGSQGNGGNLYVGPGTYSAGDVN